MSDKYSSKTSLATHFEQYRNMSEEDQNKAIMNPGHVDEAKWKKAKEAVQKEYGELKWPVVMHIYEQMGGKT